MSKQNRISQSKLHEHFRSDSRQRRQTLLALSDLEKHAGPARNDLRPNLEIIDLAPEQVSGPKRNVRKVDPLHVREVADSIVTNGFINPVLLDQHNNAIDGWIRIEAAKLLRLPAIPCIRVAHLDATQTRLVRLALNRLGEKGEFSLPELKIEFEELIIEGAAVEKSYFSGTEIDLITLCDEVSMLEETLQHPSPDTKPVSRIGDIFVLGTHRLACGDATDPQLVASLMQDEQARLVLTDEPYNVPIHGHVTGGDHREFPMAAGELTDQQFFEFNSRWMQLAASYLCDGGAFGTFIDWRGYPIIHAAATGVGLQPLNLVVWSKSNAGMGSLYRSQHELLPLFKKGTASAVNNIQLGKNGRWRSNVWQYPGASSIGSVARQGLAFHPTVKPVAMLQDALLDLTNAGDCVLDPFLGSGSTLFAAETTRRRCRGIELDPLYVDLVISRYEKISKNKVYLLETREASASPLHGQSRGLPPA